MKLRFVQLESSENSFDCDCSSQHRVEAYIYMDRLSLDKGTSSDEIASIEVLASCTRGSTTYVVGMRHEQARKCAACRNMTGLEPIEIRSCVRNDCPVFEALLACYKLCLSRYSHLTFYIYMCLLISLAMTEIKKQSFAFIGSGFVAKTSQSVSQPVDWFVK